MADIHPNHIESYVRATKLVHTEPVPTPVFLSKRYNLGNKYQSKVEHFGAKVSYEAEGTLII